MVFHLLLVPPQILTVIRQISRLQELRGKGAVGVLVRLLVARLSVLPVAAPERSFLGGARLDHPPPGVEEQHRHLQESPQPNHDEVERFSNYPEREWKRTLVSSRASMAESPKHPRIPLVCLSEGTRSGSPTDHQANPALD